MNRAARAMPRAPGLLLPGLLLLGLLPLALAVYFFFAAPAARRKISGAGLEAPASTVPQGHVYTGLCERPDSINPFTTRSSAARRYVLGLTHETLVDTDPSDGSLRPVLARSWEVLDRGRELVFELREGVRFADGTPCTPDDVLFTWQVAKAHGALLGSMADGMSLVRAAEITGGSPARLRVRLREPHFDALRAVGESWIVTRREWFEARVAELAREAGRPLPAGIADPAFGSWLSSIRAESGPGTGPYMLAFDEEGVSRWRGDLELLLVRNPLSWRKAAFPDCWNFEGIRLLFPTDPTQAWTMFRQRRLDWFPDLDLSQELSNDPSLAEDYRRVLYDNPLYGPVVMHWNLRRLPDQRVRRALGMLFDRRTIAEKYYGGAAVPAAAVFRRESGCVPEDLEPLPFDPQAARRLLREAGRAPESGRALSLRILCPSGAPVLPRICTAFAAEAKNAGILVDVQQLAFAAIAALQKDGDWDGFLVRRDFRTHADPFELLHRNGGANIMGFADPEADGLLERARRELDEPRRKQIFRAWCRRIDEMQPVSFLVFQQSALWINSHLHEARPGPLGIWAERLWVDPEHQRR